jgi:hypothetical protein
LLDPTVRSTHHEFVTPDLAWSFRKEAAMEWLERLVPPDEDSGWLSQDLPQVVDKLTPNGRVDEGSAAAVEEVGVDEAVVASGPGPA